jgi:four helix bundle protein
MPTFQALELAIDAIRHLRAPLAVIAQRDPTLADQIRRAAASVALNLSEGAQRSGRDRLHLWRVAAGSAAEVVTALRVAEAWGHLERPALTTSFSLFDRVRAMCWRLTH